MRMLLGIKGDDRMFLVDLDARSVDVIDPASLEGSAETGSDAVSNIVRARKDGVPMICGVDLAFMAGEQAEDGFSAASSFPFSEPPAAGFSEASSFPFSEPPAAGFSGASSFPFSEPPAAGFSAASSFPFSEPPSRGASRHAM